MFVPDDKAGLFAAFRLEVTDAINKLIDEAALSTATDDANKCIAAIGELKAYVKMKQNFSVMSNTTGDAGRSKDVVVKQPSRLTST